MDSLNNPLRMAAALMVLYYVVAVIAYCRIFDWTLFDALCVATANLSFFGRTTFMSPVHGGRLASTLLLMCGSMWAFLVFILVLYGEVREARRSIKSMRMGVHNGSVNLCSFETELHYRRIFIPFTQLFMVVTIGTCFFAHNEYWLISDAFSYSVMQHVAVGPEGWSGNALMAQRGSSRLFLIFYIWFFSVSAMHLIGNLCGYGLEHRAATDLGRKLRQPFDLSVLAGEFQSFLNFQRGISSYEVLVNILVYFAVLDKEGDVDRWLSQINEFASKRGELNRHEICKFTEALRSRQLMSLREEQEEEKSLKEPISSHCISQSRLASKLYQGASNRNAPDYPMSVESERQKSYQSIPIASFTKPSFDHEWSTDDEDEFQNLWPRA